MPATQNYIDASERRFLQSAYLTALGNLWSTDATMAVDTITYQDSEFGSLNISGAASLYLKYNIWSTPLTDIPSQYAITTIFESGSAVETFCWVRPTKNCTITLSTTLHKVSLSGSTFMLSTDPNDVHVGDSGVHVIDFGSGDVPVWHLIRSVPVLIPEDDERYSVGFTLTVDYADTLSPGELNFSRPTSYQIFGVRDNEFLFRTMGRIPEIFLEKDIAEYNTNRVSFPLVRFLDVLTDQLNTALNTYTNIGYVNKEDFFDPNDTGTYSTLVNQLLADSDTLAWLAQFRGRNLVVTYEPSTDGVPWTVFRLDESELDSTDVLASTSTPTTGFAGGLEEYFKWQVETGYYGHNAGTIDSMISAIQLLLTGTKYIDYTMTANTIHFETDIDETFGGGDLSVGDESPYILQILEPLRPLGMIITHEVVA